VNGRDSQEENFQIITIKKVQQEEFDRKLQKQKKRLGNITI
jgi:hypothetical protein